MQIKRIFHDRIQQSEAHIIEMEEQNELGWRHYSDDGVASVNLISRLLQE